MEPRSSYSTTLLLLLAYVIAFSNSFPSKSNLPIPIVSQSREVNADGTYKFSYSTGNNIHVREQIYLKNGSTSDEIKVAEGAYHYASPDGTPVFIRYSSDGNGFRP